MRKILICICAGLFSTAAFADMTLNKWLERAEYRGAQIEFIRVTSERTPVAEPETDPDIERILMEVEALEEQAASEDQA